MPVINSHKPSRQIRLSIINLEFLLVFATMRVFREMWTFSDDDLQENDNVTGKYDWFSFCIFIYAHLARVKRMVTF